MYSIYRKCIDWSHAKLLIIHENSCHCSFHTPTWTCSWPSYANAITLWLSIWSCVVNISREETLWVDGRDTHDPMPHTQLARKRRRVLCLRTDFSLISSAWNVFFTSGLLIFINICGRLIIVLNSAPKSGGGRGLPRICVYLCKYTYWLFPIISLEKGAQIGWGK